MKKEINTLDLIQKNYISLFIEKKNLNYLVYLLRGNLDEHDYETIYNQVTSLDIYSKCEELYNTFISFYGKYLKTLGFASAMEATFFIEHVLFYGYFSVEDFYKYHRYKYEPFVIFPLLGTRILSGYGVCRHTASFFIDLLNVLGYVTCYLGCLPITDLDSLPEICEYATHAIPGVMDGRYAFAFDYNHKNTKGDIVILDLNYTNENRLVLKDVINTFYYVIEEDDTYTNENVSIFRQEKYAFITNKDILIARSNAVEKYYSELEKLKEMKKFNFEKMKEIVRLERALFPHSDTPFYEVGLGRVKK